MKSLFRELDKVYGLIEIAEQHGKVDLLGSIPVKSHRLPIYGFSFGSEDPKAPVFGIFGGVHGLEKIGTELAVYFLFNICKRLEWNTQLQDLLKKVRIVSIPLINPTGMYLNTRANVNGVDLMRNAPTNAIGKQMPLLSGHRISPLLPWYSGKSGSLEPENEILIKFIEESILQSRFAMSLDLHSGFGFKDRIWFPYAKTTEAFPYYDLAVKMKSLVDENLKHHIYQIEPQADSYLINGDIWDHIFDLHYADNKHKENIFIPWTLEMGSWMWVKKNPLQILKTEGLFNPYLDHRFKRVMRRHWRLLDLYLNLCASYEAWANE